MVDLMQTPEFIVNTITKEIVELQHKDDSARMILLSTPKIALLMINGMLKSCPVFIYTKFGKPISNPDYEKLKKAKTIVLSRFDLKE